MNTDSKVYIKLSIIRALLNQAIEQIEEAKDIYNFARALDGNVLDKKTKNLVISISDKLCAVRHENAHLMFELREKCDLFN